MNRSLGKWKLPQPTDIKEDNEWQKKYKKEENGPLQDYC